jgi:hypothetical protein
MVAYKNKNWKEVHSTQLKLMMSFEGRALAVRKVVTNDGGKILD